MPFIHIRSLPFDEPFPVGPALEAVSRDFAERTGIGLAHVTATWTFLAPGHYAVNGRAADLQPAASHPVLVDLLAPDFNSAEMVETMLRAVAASIAERVPVALDNVFVQFQAARSGRVFDDAEIVRW